MIENTIPGTLYMTEDGLARVKWSCGSPSVSMELCEFGTMMSGGIEGMMWVNVKEIHKLEREELQSVVEVLAKTIEYQVEQRTKDDAEIVDLKQKIKDLKHSALKTEVKYLRHRMINDG
jgi:hypothetical protein